MNIRPTSMNLYDQQPYKTFWKTYSPILLLGILFRLIAILFSQGYGMHDDHFLVIEASGSWVEGADYNHWLPSSEGNTGPEGHSFTYVGLNYLLFYILKLIGIVDPKHMMFVVRLLHGLFSMLTVIFGIKITEKLADQKAATIVGYLLAVLWIFPFLSVRQLFEYTPVPFILIAVWCLIKSPQRMLNLFYSGLLLGLAISFRYQIGVLAVGIACVYFFQWKWKAFFSFCVGTLVMFCITQGIVDWCIWGYPFAEMSEYITYNLNEGTQYLPNSNYFMYFYVLIGSLLFPLGILLFIGFFNIKKDILILFIPVFLFLLFHTFYPNRQERFILTVLPAFIILGVIGFQRFKNDIFNTKIWRISWILFWVINIPLLLFTSTMSSKKSRIDAMYSLYEPIHTPKNILLDGTGTAQVSIPPRFYSKDWQGAVGTRINDESPFEQTSYDYILFFEPEKLPQRIAYYQTIYPDMELHKKCFPSVLDVLIKRMNTRNTNEYIEVWKTNRKTTNTTH